MHSSLRRRWTSNIYKIEGYREEGDRGAWQETEESRGEEERGRGKGRGGRS
jgi:hypothetical protein